MRSKFSHLCFGPVAQHLLVFAGFLTLIGCAPTKPVSHADVSPPAKYAPLPANLIVPAGVDSGVAVAATMAARSVLVGWKEDSLAQQYYEQGRLDLQEGKPLRDAVMKSKLAPQTVSPEDTTANAELFKQGDNAALKGDKALGNKRVREFSTEDLAKYPEAARQKAAEYYEQARDLFEQALEHNPWDQLTREALLLTYEDLIDLHRSLNAVDAEIAALRKYMDLYGERYGTLMRIARLEAEKGDTLQALLYSRKSEDALLTWAPLSTPNSTENSEGGWTSREYANWLRAIQTECYFEIVLGLSDPAMNDLRRLKAVCRPDVDSAYAHYADLQLEWLGWDNGNITASKLWLEFDGYCQNNQWGEARKTADTLLPILSNPTAIFQMEHLTARIDFQYLEQYEAGLNRMRTLLDQNGFAEVNSSLDSLLEHDGASGFVARMAAQRQSASPKIIELLDDYGGGCLRYGWEIESKKRDRERAYIYYYQAALIPCQKQAQALSYLADMSRNQPDRAILYGETALDPELNSTLDPATRGSLYQTLREAYRRKNDRVHTDYYAKALQAAQDAGAKP
jgi:hypothetical protein